MIEKPAELESHGGWPLFCYYAKEDARLIQSGIGARCGTDVLESYIAWLNAQILVYTMEMFGRRYDIDNLESYRQVAEEYKGIVE